MTGLAELLGAMVVVLGWGVVTAAAAMVSIALALLVAGLGLVVIGIVTIWLAAQLSKPRPPADQPQAEPPGDRTNARHRGVGPLESSPMEVLTSVSQRLCERHESAFCDVTLRAPIPAQIWPLGVTPAVTVGGSWR